MNALTMGFLGFTLLAPLIASADPVRPVPVKRAVPALNAEGTEVDELAPPRVPLERTRLRGDDDKRSLTTPVACPKGVSAQTKSSPRRSEEEPWLHGGTSLPRQLSPKERAALRVSTEWVDGAESPARGEAGAVVYTYGTSLPSVICTPLHVCDLTLEPSERVAEVHVGDPVRWKVTLGTGGPGSAITHVLVKPAEPDVETDLLVLTDRRTYVVRLVAHPREWMPRVAFSYPEEARQVFLLTQQKEEERRKATTLPGVGSMSALDFHYQMTGDEPGWRPLRVYTDGVKTYIEFPESMRSDEAPALVTLGKGDERGLVNYRQQGNKYVVDKVLQRALLVSGLGRDEERVEILHDPVRVKER